MISVGEMIDSIKQSRFIRWLGRAAQSMFIVKVMILLGVFLVAFIPVWIYSLVMWLMMPLDFWKGFAITLLFIGVIGWAQAILFALWIIVSLFIIFEDF
jgi:hypothetical protein